MQRSRGFVDLWTHAAPAAIGRSALLGALVGALGTGGWLQHQQQATQALQAGLVQEQAELARLQVLQVGVTEQTRRQEVANAQLGRMHEAQQARAHLRAILEDLAQASGPRLSLLRFDAQGLRIQGLAGAGALEDWALQRLAASWGLGAPQLSELMPTEGDQGMRFVLEWPWLTGRAP